MTVLLLRRVIVTEHCGMTYENFYSKIATLLGGFHAYGSGEKARL